jgi:hypothetical protein
VSISTLATVVAFVAPVAGVHLGSISELTGPGLVIQAVGVLAWLTGAIAIMVWLHRALANVEMLPEVSRRWSPGWAIGAWFIPIANLVLPALVLNSAARASVPTRGARALTTTLVLAWWLGFAGSSVLNGVATRGDVEVTTFWTLYGLAVAVRVVSAVALVAVLAQVTWHQERRFAASAQQWDPDLRPPIPSRPPTFA